MVVPVLRISACFSFGYGYLCRGLWGWGCSDSGQEVQGLLAGMAVYEGPNYKNA
jgi:hypothetical protein